MCQDVNFKQGKECSTSNGYSYTIENVCLVTIEVKYCLQKTIGKWQILSSVLLPGDKKTIYVCEGTGKYNYWARKYQGDDVKLPTNDEINEMD